MLLTPVASPTSPSPRLLPPLPLPSPPARVLRRGRLTPPVVRHSRGQATDSLTGAEETARCLSLLADLALDPGCARTLFRGGAVPQMLLNAQGCMHAESIEGGAGGGGTVLGRKGGSTAAGSSAAGGIPADAAEGVGDDGGGASSDDRAFRALNAESGEDSDSSDSTEAVVVVVKGGHPDAEETNAAPAVDCRGGQPRTIAVCRCRQAMRLLARLVRGLPGECPAVVVRHSGLRSIVKILETAATAAKDGADGDGWLPAAVEAAAGEALEVSECSRAWECKLV